MHLFVYWMMFCPYIAFVSKEIANLTERRYDSAFESSSNYVFPNNSVDFSPLLSYALEEIYSNKVV